MSVNLGEVGKDQPQINRRKIGDALAAVFAEGHVSMLVFHGLRYPFIIGAGFAGFAG